LENKNSELTQELEERDSTISFVFLILRLHFSCRWFGIVERELEERNKRQGKGNRLKNIAVERSLRKVKQNELRFPIDWTRAELKKTYNYHRFDEIGKRAIEWLIVIIQEGAELKGKVVER
jgi:hypothetical protein